MEDLRKAAMEIGIMQQAVNLSEVHNSQEILTRVVEYMPMPNDKISLRINTIAQWLISFGKERYLFLIPEISLAKAMLELTHSSEMELYFIIPSTMDGETKERIENNLPKGVRMLYEHDSLWDFFPRNTMIVISGYLGRDHLMILEDTYRLTEQHCKSFYGIKAFVPYVELSSAIRYDGWMELGYERVNAIWRAE